MDSTSTNVKIVEHIQQQSRTVIQYLTQSVYLQRWIIDITLSILIIVSVIIIFKIYPKFVHLKRKIPKLFLVGIPILLIIVLLGICVEGINRDSTYHFGRNSSIFNILTLLGIGLTILGTVYAYEQYKLAEDRIKRYEDFYDMISELAIETEKLQKNNNKKERSVFYFSGPIIVPGQLALNEKTKNNIINTYKENIKKACSHISDEEKISFVVLGNTIVEKRYAEANIKGKNDFLKLKELRTAFNYQTIGVINDKFENFFVENYYVSNGHTAIYAIPLHYADYTTGKVNETKMVYKKSDNISLIGFRTKDHNIVQFLEKSFLCLKENILVYNLIKKY